MAILSKAISTEPTTILDRELLPAQSLLNPPEGKQVGDGNPLSSINLSTIDLQVCLFVVVLCLATVFYVYHGSDIMSEMRRQKPEPILLLTQGISHTI